MIFLKKTGGEYAAIADRDGHHVIGALRDGYVAEYVPDLVAVEELINRSASEIRARDIFALSCTDFSYVLQQVAEEKKIEDVGALYRSVIDKACDALEVIGDIAKPGKYVLLNEYGRRVRIVGGVLL